MLGQVILEALGIFLKTMNQIFSKYLLETLKEENNGWKGMRGKILRCLCSRYILNYHYSIRTYSFQKNFLLGEKIELWS